VSDIAKRGWKPFLEGRDIERYFIRPTTKYLHYVPAEIHRARTPKVFEASEKLLIQRITGGARPLAVAYDNQQHYNKESINNLLLTSECPYDIKFLLALLNSKLMSWYYRVAFTNGSTLTVNLSKEYLSQLPIPSLNLRVATDKKLHDELVTLSEEMLRSRIGATSEHMRLDSQIDAAVYKLYNLSKSDVATIEEL
jgi:adenine-specific DNA-methyltransferase